MGFRNLGPAILRMLPVLCALSVIIFFICSIFPVRGIILYHVGDAVTQDQVKYTYNVVRSETRSRQIPRILHQILLQGGHDAANETHPEPWDAAQDSCMSLNKGWEYKLWTEKPSRDFIEREYSWFLKTYDSFDTPTERANVLGYFLLRHYGGIYMDMYHGCRANLDPLLYYPVWVTDAGDCTLSNKVMGSRPNHPFWTLVTESLARPSWYHRLLHLMTKSASGSLYLTAMWEHYHAYLASGPLKPLTRIMMDRRAGSAPWKFFTSTESEEDDAAASEMQSERRADETMFVGMAVGAGVVGVAFCIWGLARTYLARRKGYERL